MVDTPVMTQALARQIEQVDIDYTTSRLSGMQRNEGNPVGIEIREFGGATATWSEPACAWRIPRRSGQPGERVDTGLVR
jgi:hypothetical protein